MGDPFYSFCFVIVAGALIFVASSGGMALVLLWPAASFGLVAVGYFLGSVRVFGKQRDGTIHPASQILLGPYLLLAHALWRLQICFTTEPAIHFVNASLLVGRRLGGREAPKNVSVICDLTCEFSEPATIRGKCRYICYPILDAGIAPVDELVQLAKSLPPSTDSPLLIHCANGHGRTGMFAAIWLMVHGHAGGPDRAIKILKDARPGISLRRRQRMAVEEAWRSISA